MRICDFVSQVRLWESVQGWHRNLKHSLQRVWAGCPSSQLSHEIAVDSSLQPTAAKILFATKLGGKDETLGGLPICKNPD